MILSKRWLAGWLAVVALVGLLVLGYQRVEIARQRAGVRNDLRYVRLVVRDAEVHFRLGTPLCQSESSWRFHTAHYIDSFQRNSSPNFKLPWHEPVNIQATSWAQQRAYCGDSGGTFTRFMLVVHPGQTHLAEKLDPEPPCVLLVEVQQQEIDWRACGDIEVGKLAAEDEYRKKIVGWLQQPHGEFYVACTDCSMSAVPSSQAERFLKELIKTRDSTLLERVQARQLR
jgi:hypothetical protein